MKDWNDREISVGYSDGGVMAVEDFSDNLIKINTVPWPPPAIVQKLYKSNQQKAFSGKNLEIVTRKLGYYSDLQSINSEDAITWSFFGVMAEAEPAIRIDFHNWLMKKLGRDLPEPNYCLVELWRRIPHPDNNVQNGPELDFVIQTDKSVIFGEAKWASGEIQGQGMNNDKSQLQLRDEFLTKYGKRIYGTDQKFVVLYLTHRKDVNYTKTTSELLEQITWEDLASYFVLARHNAGNGHNSARMESTVFRFSPSALNRERISIIQMIRG